MKNVKINHTFTLLDILNSIEECITYENDFKGDRTRMLNRINEFKEMIKLKEDKE